MSQYKTSKLFCSVPGAVALGTIVCILLSLTMAVGIAFLVQRQILQENAIQNAAALCMAVGAFLGTLIAAAGKKERVVIICAATAAVSYLCLLWGGMLVFDSGFKGLGTGAIMVTIGSVGAVLVHILPKNRGRKGKYKYHIR